VECRGSLVRAARAATTQSKHLAAHGGRRAEALKGTAGLVDDGHGSERSPASHDGSARHDTATRHLRGRRVATDNAAAVVVVLHRPSVVVDLDRGGARRGVGLHGTRDRLRAPGSEDLRARGNGGHRGAACVEAAHRDVRVGLGGTAVLKDGLRQGILARAKSSLDGLLVEVESVVVCHLGARPVMSNQLVRCLGRRRVAAHRAPPRLTHVTGATAAGGIERANVGAGNAQASVYGFERVFDGVLVARVDSRELHVVVEDACRARRARVNQREHGKGEDGALGRLLGAAIGECVGTTWAVGRDLVRVAKDALDERDCHHATDAGQMRPDLVALLEHQ